MPRKPDERYDQAYELFKKGCKLVEIASQLNLPEGTVRRWKSTHKWDSERSVKKTSVRKRGGQPGNKNATGPPGNRHAEKHGFFSKWLPEETKEIIGEMPSDELEILWMNIQLQFAVVIRGQRLMYVHDQHDKTVERIEYKDGNVTGERWEVQQAWDKHATFMNAQSRAMKTLESMIKQYDEMVHKNWNIASEEQKERLELLKAQRKKLELDTGAEEEDEKVVIVNDIKETESN